MTVLIMPEGLPGSTEGPWIADIDVWHGEDWYDPMAIVDVNGDPFDLTGAVLHWYARPSYDHTTRFVHLTTTGAAGIIMESLAGGLAAFKYAKADVEANLPITLPGRHWEQFLDMTFTDPDIGAQDRHLFLGRLFVHPAREADTPP